MRIWQIAINQQMRDFLKHAILGKIFNIVSTIMKIIPAVAYSAESRIARNRAGQGN